MSVPISFSAIKSSVSGRSRRLPSFNLLVFCLSQAAVCMLKETKMGVLGGLDHRGGGRGCVSLIHVYVYIGLIVSKLFFLVFSCFIWPLTRSYHCPNLYRGSWVLFMKMPLDLVIYKCFWLRTLGLGQLFSSSLVSGYLCGRLCAPTFKHFDEGSSAYLPCRKSYSVVFFPNSPTYSNLLTDFNSDHMPPSCVQ